MGWIKENWQGVLLGTLGAEGIKGGLGLASSFNWSEPARSLLADPGAQSALLSIVLIVLLCSVYYRKWTVTSTPVYSGFLLIYGAIAIGIVVASAIAIIRGEFGPLIKTFEDSPKSTAFCFVFIAVWLAVDLRAMIRDGWLRPQRGTAPTLRAAPSNEKIERP